MTLSDDLSKLEELRNRGALTEEEFARAKERLLNSDRAHPSPPFAYTGTPFRRSRNDRWFGGVCGGIGKATGTESWAWRLLFTVLFFGAGAGLFVYLLLWIFVPIE